MRIHTTKIRSQSLFNPEKIAKTLPVEPDWPPCISFKTSPTFNRFIAEWWRRNANRMNLVFSLPLIGCFMNVDPNFLFSNFIRNCWNTYWLDRVLPCDNTIGENPIVTIFCHDSCWKLCTFHGSLTRVGRTLSWGC